MRIRVEEDLTVLDELILHRIENTPKTLRAAGTEIVSTSKVCEDIVTPFFHAKIRAGVVINNPCSITVVKKRVDHTQYVYTNIESGHPEEGLSAVTSGAGYSQYIRDNYSDHDTLPIPQFEGKELALEQAKLFALSNIDSTPYAFAEDLAELRSTLGYMGLKALKLRNVSRSFKSAKRRLIKGIKSPEDRTKLVAGLWLEYRFVVTPLVQSMTDFMDAYNDNKYKSLPIRRTARGFASSSIVESFPLTTSLSPPMTGTCLSSVGLNVKAGIFYSTDNPNRSWRFKYGVRNKDIPVTMWNVIPLSFMVDRVVNISASLKAMTNLADPSVSILAAWVTTKTTYVSQWSYTNRDSSPTYSYSLSGDVGVEETFYYDRQPWQPSLTDAIPSLELKGLIDSSTKIADVLALVRANFG